MGVRTSGSNPGLDQALRSMAVPHDAPASVRQPRALHLGKERLGFRRHGRNDSAAVTAGLGVGALRGRGPNAKPDQALHVVGWVGEAELHAHPGDAGGAHHQLNRPFLLGEDVLDGGAHRRPAEHR